MRAAVTALGFLATTATLGPIHASAAIVRTPLGPPHEVALTDLLGRSPDAVREALSAAPAPWPVRYTLEVAEPCGGERAYLPMIDFLQDTAARDIQDRARTGASDLPRDWTQCAVKRSDALTSSEVDETYTSLLEFRQGRLTAIWLGRLPRSTDLPRFLQADGPAGFPSAAGLIALPPATRLTAACTRYTAEPIPPRRGAPPGYNWPQALMLLPLAPALPVKNARRIAARRDGEVLYDALAPGSVPPAALTDPAARSRLVQVEPTTAPDSALFRTWAALRGATSPQRTTTGWSASGGDGSPGGSGAWAAGDRSPKLRSTGERGALRDGQGLEGSTLRSGNSLALAGAPHARPSHRTRLR